MGDIVGIFGNKAKPSRSGTFHFEWPASSGLGRGPYAEEADRQEAYLVYSSRRRRHEGVMPEDTAAMDAAQSILQRCGIGDELLLISGPVDLRALNDPPGSEFAGQGAVTDRTTVLWWQGRRGHQDEFVLLPHQNLQPKVDGGYGYHFVWLEGAAGDFPPPTSFRPLRAPGFAITPHFSRDGHGNRRGASVQATLRHVRGDS